MCLFVLKLNTLTTPSKNTALRFPMASIFSAAVSRDDTPEVLPFVYAGLDHALLMSGPMMLPLVPFGIRNYYRKKDHKRRLLGAVNDSSTHRRKGLRLS